MYNRASSPNSTVFYSSESVDTALKELQPEVGSIITLGVWQPKENNKFISYPIMANPSSKFINIHAKSASLAFDEFKKRNNPLLGLFMDGYFNVLNHEYSKPINNKKEYMVSAHFSEKIFSTTDPNWKYDCITYPSVGNDFTHNNLAFKSDIVTPRLKLTNAIEMEIIRTYYDKQANLKNPNLITVAAVRVMKKSKEINNDGRIHWE